MVKMSLEEIHATSRFFLSTLGPIFIRQFLNAFYISNKENHNIAV